jgi:2-phosphosulfolactate phosphatase
VTEPADAQDRYQVRFDLGLDGARRIGESAHLLVWCDAIATQPVPVDALPHRLEIIDARLGAATAIAARLLALQADRGERTMVAVVAAGSPVESPEGFPVEDVLLAGAVIDALGAAGIDATSPEAAAAAAAFQGLRGAVVHMLTASVAGRALAENEGADALAAARARLESHDLVTLREHSHQP